MNAVDQTTNLEEILSQLRPGDRALVSSLIERDPLTGAYNRRKFDKDLELILAMSERTKKGASLLMIDIDHFKKYNDQHGHQKGDQVLREVTRCIERSLRDYDKTHIYRYGGEEFVVIIPDTSNRHAFNIGDRIRKNVRTKSSVSVSVGISHYKENSDNLESLIDNADKALYEAKRTGRDRVALYEEAS
jgi:diguanylate cyclase (GGDEF)-like protein